MSFRRGLKRSDLPTTDIFVFGSFHSKIPSRLARRTDIGMTTDRHRNDIGRYRNDIGTTSSDNNGTTAQRCRNDYDPRRPRALHQSVHLFSVPTTHRPFSPTTIGQLYRPLSLDDHFFNDRAGWISHGHPPPLRPFPEHFRPLPACFLTVSRPCDLWLRSHPYFEFKSSLQQESDLTHFAAKTSRLSAQSHRSK